MSIKVSVVVDKLACETTGLRNLVGYEIRAAVNNSLLLEGCVEFVKFVSDYVAAGNVIRAGETISYGYWMTKAVFDGDNLLYFMECDATATEFVLGVSLAVTYWREQNFICQKVGADFSPPNLDKMVVISDGVYEGGEVEGVRYPSPAHMSGWWLTTDQYNGDSSTLKAVHAYHISEKRPDLVRFLALPFGYRFFSPQSDVWFDLKVAREKS